MAQSSTNPVPADQKDVKADHKSSQIVRDLVPLSEKALTVIVLGASGDLALKKTYPSLFALYAKGLLPKHAHVVGFARSALKIEDFRQHIGSKMPAGPARDEFLAMCHYTHGADYESVATFAQFNQFLLKLEGEKGANRIFYFALPPSVFTTVAKGLKAATMSQSGWNRIIIEKPFGKDSASSKELSQVFLSLFAEEQLYRIDHYLGKEIVQNLLVMRFANMVFEPLWNRNYVSSVMITFKETDGVEGRGAYFDEFGIIRDVMQNHLMQILSLIAMEPPVTLDAEDVRNEKVKVLRAIPHLQLKDMVIGQYVADAKSKYPSYAEDPSVQKALTARKLDPKGSLTPTFALATLSIRNPRWEGVPFILKCGKGLNERKAEVRVQFKKFPGMLFEQEQGVNELVFRVQPNEAVYLKLITKTPGLTLNTEQAELDLSYKSRFKLNSLPDAYERLILDVMRGDRNLFVRADELEESWKIFTPVLHQLEREKVKPEPYVIGSRGPASADALVARTGFLRNAGYQWPTSISVHDADGVNKPLSPAKL